MKIITGYRAEPHITAQQDRNVNMGIFGSGTYIVDMGSKLAATVVSANEITIANGLLVAEGCTAEIERGTSESLEIENGSQGMLRTDLIVARYTKASGTGVEDMQLAVITGTPAASNPADPSYNTGSIAAGDTLVDFPLYKVSLNGISIETVTRIPVIAGVAKTSDVSAVSSALSTLSNTVTSLSNKIGSTAMGTAATTVTGAIRELLTKINTLTSNLSTTNSNVSSVTSRTTALESKTTGIVGTYRINVNAGATQYLQLHALSMYLVMVNGGTTNNGIRGMYLVGTTTGNALGIKAISTANSVTVTDGGNGLIKFVNNSDTTMRLAIICTYGTSI